MGIYTRDLFVHLYIILLCFCAITSGSPLRTRRTVVRPRRQESNICNTIELKINLIQKTHALVTDRFRSLMDRIPDSNCSVPDVPSLLNLDFPGMEKVNDITHNLTELSSSHSNVRERIDLSFHRLKIYSIAIFMLEQFQNSLPEALPLGSAMFSFRGLKGYIFLRKHTVDMIDSFDLIMEEIGISSHLDLSFDFGTDNECSALQRVNYFLVRFKHIFFDRRYLELIRNLSDTCHT